MLTDLFESTVLQKRKLTVKWCVEVFRAKYFDGQKKFIDRMEEVVTNLVK
jgi:hypothetical protein